MEVLIMFGLTPYNRRNNILARRNDIFDLRSVFEDFFGDSFFGGFFSAAHPIRADIRETDKEFIIEAEIPGVKKEDIKLELRDNNLTISVENSVETNEERENYIRRKRRYGSYSRSFYVDNVRPEDVTAKYNDGILTIVLPKAEEIRRKGYNIEIK